MNQITMKAHQRIAETACAIVEHLHTGGIKPTFLLRMADDEGAAQERSFIVAELAEFIERAYFYAEALGYDDAFDWEFVPAVLDYMQDWRFFHEESARAVGVAVYERWQTEQNYRKEIAFDY